MQCPKYTDRNTFQVPYSFLGTMGKDVKFNRSLLPFQLSQVVKNSRTSDKLPVGSLRSVVKNIPSLNCTFIN